MSKVKVQAYGRSDRPVVVEEGATKGATFGVDTYLSDGSVLTLAQLVAMAAGAVAPPPNLSKTTWALILDIPPNVTALAESTGTGLFSVTGDGTGALQELEVGASSAVSLSILNPGGVAGPPMFILDPTLNALSPNNWAANAFPIGTGPDTLAQVLFGANTFPGRGSTGNLVAKTITDDAFLLLADPLVPRVGTANTWALTQTFSLSPIVSTGANNALFVLDANAGTARRIVGRTGGLNRWQWGMDGSDNYINASYDNSGALIGQTYDINRLTRVVNFTINATIAGGQIYYSGNFTPSSKLDVAATAASDLNSTQAAGTQLYTYTGATSNPPPGGSSGMLINVGRISTGGGQFSVRETSSGSAIKGWFRGYNGGTFSAWVEIAHRYWAALTAASGTVNINLDAEDAVIRTALSANVTINNPTGTKFNGRVVAVRLRDNGSARTITWGSEYRGMTTALPATTVANKTLYVYFVVNADENTLDILNVQAVP